MHPEEMAKLVTLEEIKVILLDIEGTTTSISFVKDTLFPYVREHVAEYLKTHWGEEKLERVVKDLRTLSQEDVEKNLEGATVIPEGQDDCDVLQVALVSNVLWQMDSDRKTTPLKELQGMIWKQGYHDGHLQGHLFEDVYPSLKHWHALGKQLCIYSSGSIQAQKLLYTHTINGSLEKILSGYFDTTTGPKAEEESYRKIALSLDVKPREVLFLTDIPKEAEGAKSSGMHVCLVVRPGNAPLQEQDLQQFPTIHSFLQLQ